MTRVSKEEAKHIAQLAALEVNDEELEAMASDLSSILAHMSALSSMELPTHEDRGVPTATGNPGVLREDDVVDSDVFLSIEAIVPLVRDGFFLVPRLGTHDTGLRESDG